jgi:hypothetical protein
MNTTDWNAIPLKLKAAGFTVFYERISYAPENPLWRAHAQRDGQEWSALGRNLETALVELDKQAQEPAHDWRKMKVVA